MSHSLVVALIAMVGWLALLFLLMFSDLDRTERWVGFGALVVVGVIALIALWDYVL